MNSSILLACLFFIPLIVLLMEKKRRKTISNKIPYLPALPGLPFIGNIHELGSLPQHSLRELSKKHGPLFLMHLGSIPTLIVSSAKLAEQFMKSHDIVFASRPSSKVSKLLSYNNIDIAFSPYGECWRQMRKVGMTHLLSHRMVQSFSSIRKEEVALLLDNIAVRSASSETVCLTEMMNSLVSNILCRVVLGSSMGEERRKLVCDLVQRNSTLFSVVFLEDLFPCLGWLDILLGLESKLRSHFNVWDSLFDEFIDNHINKPSSQGTGGTDASASLYTADFIDVLLELQKNSTATAGEFVLTKNHIKATLMDMFAAGTDTSFITLDWCMAELIRNPEVMKKAQEEVRGVANNGAEFISEEQLGGLDYLNAVINEVLRLHPPIPLLLPRESTTDCKVMEYAIPKGTRVIVNAWAIARDETNWESAEEFMPERFMSSKTDYKGKDFSFIPFGAGRRICPGMSFAVVVVQLALANLLLRFDWNLPAGGISHQDMKMEDTSGLVALRKEKLHLLPIPFFQTK